MHNNKLASKVERYTLQTKGNFNSTSCQICRPCKSVIKELTSYIMFQRNCSALKYEGKKPEK